MTAEDRTRDPLLERMRAQIEATPLPRGRRIHPRRWPLTAARRVQFLLLGSTSLTIAAVTLAVVLTIGSTAGTPPAYAGHPTQSITITLERLTHDVAALNRRFRALGIQETVIPITAGCHSRGGSRPIVMHPDPDFEDRGSATLTFTPGRGRSAPAGWGYVMAGRRMPHGKVLAFIGALQKPTPTCLPYRPSPRQGPFG